VYFCPSLQSNSIEHIDLDGLTGLCIADLSDNRLASIHGLSQCNGLVNLDLSENRLARLAGLEGCGAMQRLNVDGNLIINSKVKTLTLKRTLLYFDLCFNYHCFPRRDCLVFGCFNGLVAQKTTFQK